MRRVLPNSKKWKRLANVVGSATVASIRAAGFDVIADPSPNFTNHGRLIHSAGLPGFDDHALGPLSLAFVEATGC